MKLKTLFILICSLGAFIFLGFLLIGNSANIAHFLKLASNNKETFKKSVTSSFLFNEVGESKSLNILFEPGVYEILVIKDDTESYPKDLKFDGTISVELVCKEKSIEYLYEGYKRSYITNDLNGIRHYSLGTFKIKRQDLCEGGVEVKFEVVKTPQPIFPKSKLAIRVSAVK